MPCIIRILVSFQIFNWFIGTVEDNRWTFIYIVLSFWASTWIFVWQYVHIVNSWRCWLKYIPYVLTGHIKSMSFTYYMVKCLPHSWGTLTSSVFTVDILFLPVYLGHVIFDKSCKQNCCMFWLASETSYATF